MNEDYPQQIVIGDTTYRIVRFKGLKAALAGSLVSRVMREVPELQKRVTEFRKEFRDNNTLIITPAMAKMPKFAPLGLSDQDFRTAGGNIEFPEEPEPQTILVHVFPDLFDLADKELRKFLALLVIPNSELEEADDADDVDEALDKWGKRLMRQGDIDELLELIVVGMDVFKDQLMRKRDRLSRLNIPLLKALLTEREEPATNGHGETPPTQMDVESSPPPSSAPASFTDLPSDSDGIDEQLSIESLGTN